MFDMEIWKIQCNVLKVVNLRRFGKSDFVWDGVEFSESLTSEPSVLREFLSVSNELRLPNVSRKCLPFQYPNRSVAEELGIHAGPRCLSTREQ